MVRDVCPCCERIVDELRKSPWVSEAVCAECLYVWYNEGETDPEKIKARVWKKIKVKSQVSRKETD